MLISNRPDVGTNKKAQNKEEIYTVFELQTEIRRSSVFHIISRHADFTKFWGIINIDVKNKSRDLISKIKLEQSVKCQKMLFRKNGLQDEN